MRRFILSFAVLAIAGMVFVGTADARGRGGVGHGAAVHGGGYGGGGVAHGAVVHAGVYGGGGRFYAPGYLHGGFNGWGRVWWNPGYRCNFYFYNNLWYYWYAPMGCYLPTTYVATYPPTVGVVAPPAAPAPGPMPMPYPTGTNPYAPTGMNPYGAPIPGQAPMYP